ncbi:MAG: response regulator transcription factor [Anaerolineae bacterium]|jgi:two-component system response regulator RegX3|nr:response regulator transcription factor [Anaerolineae bacterium]
MQSQFRVLVIEDEPDMLDMLELILTANGFEVVKAPDALSGLRLAFQARPDAILMDVMMPDMDGFEGCRRLRELTDVPIIFVTGKANTDEDIVRGFSLGADDYVTKPFNPSELVSRLNACLRRTGKQSEDEVEYLSPSPSIVLDCGRHVLMLENNRIYLAPKEFQVLQLLIRHVGKVLSHDAILAQVWGPERVGEAELVKQYVYRLRRKVEPNPGAPRYIHSVRGEGYFFEIIDRA